LNIIETSLKRVIKKKFDKDPKAGEKYFTDVQGRIQTSTNVNEAVQSTDLVIEAIIENLETKQKLFQQIDQVAPKFVDPISPSSIQLIDCLLDILFLQAIHLHYQ
jgi:3-hydroxyacyl-CoA dehydrogenase